MLLKLQLLLLLEQQGLLNDDDVELQDKILDKELSEEQLNDKLEDFILDEQLGLLQLSEMQLRLEL